MHVVFEYIHIIVKTKSKLDHLYLHTCDLVTCPSHVSTTTKAQPSMSCKSVVYLYMNPSYHTEDLYLDLYKD